MQIEEGTSYNLIKTQAKKFGERFVPRRFAKQDEYKEVFSFIKKELLLNYHFTNDKGIWLEEIRLIANQNLFIHKINCPKLECGQDFQFESLQRLIVQELDILKSEQNEFFHTNESNTNFSGKEVEALSKKIDEIKEALSNRMDVSCEILFTEIEELKGLSKTLGKKNWRQILKGKLMDLGLSKLADRETIEFIHSSLTENLPKLIS